MGELLVEIMRVEPDIGLGRADLFRGPYPSGAAAIFIDTAARLGVPSGIYGGVGDDEFGRTLTERLKADGVDCRYVDTIEGSTAVAFVSYTSDGNRSFIFHINNTPAVAQRFTPPNLHEPASFFHVMGCSLMASPTLRREIVKAASWFAEKGTKISFDPNIRPELLGGRSLTEIVEPILQRTAVLFPGNSELKLLAGAQTVDSAAEVLFQNKLLELIVLKLGKRGARIFSRCGNGGISTTEVQPYPVHEIDPTGAGDSFDAGFLAGLVAGRAPEKAGAVAAKAGALSAAAFGPMEGDISLEVMQA